jgi:Sulfotransferase domain
MPNARPDGKIFGIGANKTGTSSLVVALRRLGFRAAHWDDHYDWSSGTSPVTAAVASNRFRIPLLEDYDAIADLPIPSVFKQLDAAYPSSKFILTTRDVEAWHESIKQHLAIGAEVFGRHGLICEEQMFYRAERYDPAVFVQRYLEHQREVLDYFATKRGALLVIDFNRGDSWTRLCSFLGVRSIPCEPFPHENRTCEAIKHFGIEGNSHEEL